MTPAMFQVAQIDHVELFVPDRYEAARWYERTLGLTVLSGYESWAEDPRGPLMISPDGGGTKLALFTGEPQGGRPTAGFHRVAFRVDGSGFLAFLNHVENAAVFNEAGNEVRALKPRDHGQAFSVYFCDPWGHRLEVTTYDAEQVRECL
jgi:catechol 2,3-dioxygenase-like lactoylglutathione lyase family enzyme